MGERHWLFREGQGRKVCRVRCQECLHTWLYRQQQTERWPSPNLRLVQCWDISFGLTLVTSRRKYVNECWNICSLLLGFMYSFYSQRLHRFKQGRLAFFCGLENGSSLENASLQSTNCEIQCSSYSWWALNVSMQLDREKPLQPELVGCKAVLVWMIAECRTRSYSRQENVSKVVPNDGGLQWTAYEYQ